VRKLIESTLVSLDGVFGDPHRWATEYFDHEAERYALELLSEADAMLMGRRTYEFFAAAFPHQSGDYGARINTIRKYVFSNSLREAAWSNSSIVSGDAVTAVRSLQQQGGKSLVIYGHGLLSQALLQHRLVSELKLWIHPLFVGDGPRVFREGTRHKLKLVTTRTLTTGVVVATYQPVPA
jgi:dihydrofolate reductase